jgi:ATP-dependent DNA helicase RecQ
MGNLNELDSVLKLAVDKIRSGDIEPSRIIKAVLVIDEAQDMSTDEFELVNALMELNEEMKVLLVGDDDQNIYEFRGSNSQHMVSLITAKSAKKYELVENYRSKANLVAFSNKWAEAIPNRLKEVPIIASDPTDGQIRIIEHRHGNLLTPVVQTIQQADLMGSTCILTKTNEEAVQITGLLVKNGYQAKLIQTNDGFNLYNLKELRYFSDLITNKDESPIVSDEEWAEAKRKLGQNFRQSSKLDSCNSIIKEFEVINIYRKYKSDWKTFLAESKFEDFIQVNSETIYVSTIHKAKGREFDNVFLVLDNFNTDDDKCKRQFYVAITRAKSNITIHYNGSYLRNIIINNMSYSNDHFAYPPPQNISCLLTHRDINLGYFEFVQHRMHGLVSGNSLSITKEGLSTPRGLVVKFSNEFSNSLHQLEQKGYKMTEAKANFFVHWFNGKIDKELNIILPEVSFLR